jgi:ABC-type Zn uptake system ZnuABC Zn-binding protein ZnuA
MGKGFIGRIVSPEGRLTFSVLSVLFATVVIGHGGVDHESTARVAPPSSVVQEPGASSVPVASNLRVLVSDPANTALVREIAGDLLIVESIIPPGGNGHTYEPVPSDAVKAASANLYIENGLELNPSVTRFVSANIKEGIATITLADAIPKNEVISTDSAEQIANHGHAHAFNAHLWTDPVYAIAYVNRITAALSALDLKNAPTYRERADKFITRLQNLDVVFKAAIASIPQANRKLVVYHDSWSYFGRRYGIPIVGAIQPVTFSEPSADEIRRMIDQVKRERVPAFFGSEVFPSDVLETVSQETGAKYHADLSDEELPGTPGTKEHSYEGMMIANVRLITSALGGDVSLLANLVPGENA